MAKQEGTGEGMLKRTLYVGGLEENVDKNVLQAAFNPFGEVKTCEIPVDQKTGNHRGFGFVEFFEVDDAQAAIDNMNDAELYGRTLRVNLAKAPSNKPSAESTKPVWADDFFYRKKLMDEGIELDEDAFGGEQSKDDD